MSVTVSNCDEICHSPTNASPAKMLYTFKKEPRFTKKIRVLYFTPYSVAISFTTPIQSRSGQPPSVSATSTTSQKSTVHLI